MQEEYSKKDVENIVGKSSFLSFIESEIDNAETYLDTKIRPVITENLKYYHGELPAKAKNGTSYVENVVFPSVEHMLANTTEAFGGEDLLEITPDDSSDVLAVSLVSELINDILDRENNRADIFEGWFRDALNSKNGVLKAYKDIRSDIHTEYFNDLNEESLTLLEAQVAMDELVDYETVITEEKVVNIEGTDPVDETKMVSAKQTTLSGYIEYKKDKEVVKLENIKNENFIIDADATRIDNARCVGHKSATTFSDLLEMGFEEDALKEVYERLSDDTSDVNDNQVSNVRRNAFGNGDNETSDDIMMREVTLYELYIRTSLQTSDVETKWKRACLYQVFYIEGVILGVEQVNRAPYVDIIPFGDAHSFWGKSYADILRNNQRASTGIMRGYMENIHNANRPRYSYTKGMVDERSLMSTVTGSCVAVKNGGMVGLLQTNAMPQGTMDMLNRLEVTRQQATGVSYQGAGLLSDVVKSGGSTATASMALSQMQMYEKKVIKSFANRGIKPLINLIYNILREEFSEYTVKVNGEEITINPSTDLPDMNNIKVRTELGSNARMEKTMALMGFRDSLVMQSQAPEAGKLVKAENLYNLNKSILELQDIKVAESYMQSPQQIAQSDELQQMLNQMQQQMQGIQQQMQILQVENDNLKVLNNERVQKELMLKENKQEIDAQIAADKQSLAENEFKLKQQVAADKQALDEVKVEAEISNPEVAFK